MLFQVHDLLLCKGRATDSETAMPTVKESGHYAIAGFLYQFIGSGVAAFEIYQGPPSDGEPTEVLLVERFGQDAAILPVDGSDKKPRLIQYKYSSKGDTIAPCVFNSFSSGQVCHFSACLQNTTPAFG